MKLLWTEPARDDRRSIREYIAQDNPVAAVEMDEQLSSRANQLTEQPDIGRATWQVCGNGSSIGITWLSMM